MFKKIDCVMIRVDDVAAAEKFYSEVFGLRPLWREGGSVGMGLPATDAEIVLHNNAEIPNKVEVHYLVDDVVAALKNYLEKGCRVMVPPFEVLIGKCAVIEDPFVCWIKLQADARITSAGGPSGADRNRDDEAGASQECGSDDDFRAECFYISLNHGETQAHPAVTAGAGVGKLSAGLECLREQTSFDSRSGVADFQFESR
jgi:predicted enzyme related to lactoylglutathione lyase